MKYWNSPPSIKIYEALGCIADERIVEKNDEIRVYSSSGNKYYIVEYDEKNNAIVSNDNGSYYVGYLGYPAIAYLMTNRKLSFNEEYAQALKGIHWKDLNTKFNNDYFLVEEYIHKHYMQQRGIDVEEFRIFVNVVLEEIKTMKLKQLSFPSLPPTKY
ncbi:MAG: hypothetical protein ACLFPL_04135 [Candidatus Nanoarchaeia archaeon]